MRFIEKRTFAHRAIMLMFCVFVLDLNPVAGYAPKRCRTRLTVGIDLPCQIVLKNTDRKYFDLGDTEVLFVQHTTIEIRPPVPGYYEIRVTGQDVRPDAVLRDGDSNTLGFAKPLGDRTFQKTMSVRLDKAKYQLILGARKRLKGNASFLIWYRRVGWGVCSDTIVRLTTHWRAATDCSSIA